MLKLKCLYVSPDAVPVIHIFASLQLSTLHHLVVVRKTTGAFCHSLNSLAKEQRNKKKKTQNIVYEQK